MNKQGVQATIGLIGLAVMGENIVLNMERHGFRAAVYNRTVAKVDAFVGGRASGKQIIGTHSIQELCATLERPRKVMLLVKAGQPVDDYIAQLIPYLEPGDVIIDGGNSHFTDTIRRTAEVEKHGLLYVGMGVSGGEEGALNGPSLMPGGSPEAWPLIRPIFQAIAAQVDGQPCCEWVGSDGAGHFVKMIHNGIEYGDMQLIAEVYHLMKQLLAMSPQAMQATFAKWNQAELKSYLIEITADILGRYDDEGQLVLDTILDSAGQKGTGKWTALTALDMGVPVTLISEAVYARLLSAQRDERQRAAAGLSGPDQSDQPRPFQGDQAALLAHLEQALYAAKLVSYAQGYALLRQAAQQHGWQLDYGQIALLWRGGCIIRSAFLDQIAQAFARQPDLTNLLLDEFFRTKLQRAQASWRAVVATATLHGVPVPALSAGLAFFDGYRSAWLPASLIQAQRDYFGAHTYQRVDRDPGEYFHTNWTGQGGDTVATTYTA